MNIQKFVRDYCPDRLHEYLIGVYNSKQYAKRHSGQYESKRRYFEKWDRVRDVNLIQAEQQRRLTEFMNYVATHSEFYSRYVEFKTNWDVASLRALPIVTKNDLVTSADQIATVPPEEAIASYTGGTTGASLKVLYTVADSQERFAVLDNFRSQYGYCLGKRTAWFSGKELLSRRDVRRKKFYKDDRANGIRFFSTFHFNQETAAAYWEALTRFKPEFFVGFPFSVYEICRFAESKGWSENLADTVFFPTAETVTQEHRRCIGKVLGCRIVDQYASSEGAPFILQCESGRLHIHPLTGIFEVVDADLNPVQSGQILVTAFATKGTPLVRYKIGDAIALSQDGQCECGSVFPLVDHIEGRVGDYLLSKENGRISGANLGNSTKSVNGILCFQGVQETADRVKINVVADHSFTEPHKQRFEAALRERLGKSMEIEIRVVDQIAKGKSGKFKFIINHLISGQSPSSAEGVRKEAG